MPVTGERRSSWTSHVASNLVPYHGTHSKLVYYALWSLPRMVKFAALGVAVVTGLLIAGCAGGFAQPGLSLPAADGVQTVSDAADALDGHRALATENAKAAIAVTDALGSFVRDISADQRTLGQTASRGRGMTQLIRQYTVERNGKRILSGSELVLRTSDGSYCQSSAGYSVNGIPSLDATFGWESGAFTGGARANGGRGSAVWSANASGAVVQGQIGAFSLARSGAVASCPMTAPAFVLHGGTTENPFSLPISMAFRHGELTNLSVVSGRFASGDSLEVTTANRQPVEVNGVISSGHTSIATFRANAAGSGTLTITSTGAQYVIADWIVVGT
jgi:hypothetical protein